MAVRQPVLVDRRRVLSRLRRLGTPVMLLCAPAGYGKTYIARRVAREDPVWDALDCVPAEVTAHVVAALLQRLDEKRGFRESATLILENADHLAIRGEARAIAEHISDLPLGLRVILCSRSDAVTACTAGIAPHLIAVLGRDDLGFDESEMRQLFPLGEFDEAEFVRVVRLVTGWPAGALYVRRVWPDLSEGDALAGPARSPVLGDLLDYIYTEVAQPLEPELQRALTVAVALGDARDADLETYATAEIASPARMLVRGLQIARYGPDHILEVHPLVAAAIKRNRPALVEDVLLSAAARAEQADAFTRAARCYIQAGQPQNASRVLAALERKTVVVPMTVYEEVNERYRSIPFTQYPDIWVALAPTRRLMTHPDVLAHEGEALLGAFEGALDPLLFNGVVAMTTIALMDTGLLDEAAHVAARAIEPESEYGAVAFSQALTSRAMLHAHRGEYASALEDANRVRARSARHPMWYSLILTIDAAVARARGQWEIEYDIVEQIVTLSSQEPSPAILGRAYAEGLYGAWLAGEDVAFDAYRTSLRILLLQQHIPGLFSIAVAAQGAAPNEQRIGSALWDARAFLIASASTGDPNSAARHARRAVELADHSGEAFTRVVTRIALAEKVPATRKKMLSEACAVARTIESPSLIDSCEALLRNGEVRGLLVPLINRLRAASGESDAPLDAPIEIRIASGSVQRGDAELQLSVGGMSLLAALASEPRGISSETLCDRLWPDATYEQAYKALKMCVHRTRQQLGDPKAIETTDGGYALAEHVSVDVRFLPSLLEGIARGNVPGPVEAQLDRIFVELAHGRPPSFAHFEWFTSMEAFLERATRDIGAFLARRALRSGDHARALGYAQRLVALDPLDETARELAISAHLRAKDRSSALLEYRQYQRLLSDELGVDPSPELKALLGT